MNKCILIFLTFVLFFWAVPSTRAEEFVLEYETAFTVRDNEPGGPDGIPDAIDDTAGGGFWGLITNSTIQYDEFLLEFDISNLGSVNSAEFNFKTGKCRLLHHCTWMMFWVEARMIPAPPAQPPVKSFNR